MVIKFRLNMVILGFSFIGLFVERERFVIGFLMIKVLVKFIKIGDKEFEIVIFMGNVFCLVNV